MEFIGLENDIYKRELDMNAFLKEIDRNKSIFSHLNINDYIEKWKKALYNCYNSEADSIVNLNTGKYYYESIFIGDRELRFHFDINKAIDYSRTLKKQLIPMKHFADKVTDLNSHTIKYSPPSDLTNKYDYCSCNEPIILVDFMCNNFFYLVIDGNHRIEARRQKKVENINAVLIPPTQTVTLFKSRFEIALYIFLYEGSLLAQGNLSILSNSGSRLYI